MSLDVDHTITLHPEMMNDKAIVMSSDKWHPGVIAIVSTRIAKLYNRPTVMIAIEKDIGKGSVRSIPEFPLLAALKRCSDILINYGGHDFAAGLTIKEHISKNLSAALSWMLMSTSRIRMCCVNCSWMWK